jgi:predicted RecB family nuclease
MRISGVGEEYSELLEAAGVDTIKELRNRNPETLTAMMEETNKTKKLTRLTPKQAQVEKWVAEAKTLKPVISH